ncbi:TPA: Rha family transcriptional regulator [Staphylococcus delphini]|nr:Rha family transcriptional regulator [Staphylococcus delphini]
MGQLEVNGKNFVYEFVKLKEGKVKLVSFEGESFYKWEDIRRCLQKRLGVQLNTTHHLAKIKEGKIIKLKDLSSNKRRKSNWINELALYETLGNKAEKYEEIYFFFVSMGIDIKRYNESLDIENAKLVVKDGNVFISSLDVAKETGRLHYHILEKIDYLLTNQNLDSLLFNGFKETNYKDKKGEKRRCYMLSKDAFILLMFNMQGNLEFKIKYIVKFNEMEQELKAVKKGEKQPEEIKSIDKDTSLFANVIEKYSNHRISDIAEELDVVPYDLNMFLCRKGVQYKDGYRYRLCDGFEEDLIKEAYYYDDDAGDYKAFMVWTEKGKQFILDLIERAIEAKENKLKYMEENNEKQRDYFRGRATV